MNRAMLKEQAKQSLKGNYGQSIAVIIIMWVISFAAGLLLYFMNFEESTTNTLSHIADFLINGFIYFGSMSFFLKISRNETVTFRELFSKIHLFIPYVVITILTSIFTSLWSLLFIIPGIIAALSYSMVYYIALDNPELSALDVIRKSKEMMRGHKGEYFTLLLSFLGWCILGIFTLGILYLWLMPYIEVTVANFYNKLKETTQV